MTRVDAKPLRRRPRGRGRLLCANERLAVSPGLLRALDGAGARPRIVDRRHPAAAVAALWRGEAPVLTRGEEIWWAGAAKDLSGGGLASVGLLQHELQHVLDYVEGRLTALGYLLHPRHWSYELPPLETAVWSRMGAEARAVAAERWLLSEHGYGRPADRTRLEALLPWTAPSKRADPGLRPRRPPA